LLVTAVEWQTVCSGGRSNTLPGLLARCAQGRCAFGRACPFCADTHFAGGTGESASEGAFLQELPFALERTHRPAKTLAVLSARQDKYVLYEQICAWADQHEASLKVRGRTKDQWDGVIRRFPWRPAAEP
jgi:hypothetical protein